MSALTAIDADVVGRHQEPSGARPELRRLIGQRVHGGGTAAAEALVDWLAGDPTASGDSDTLIIGDLNSYDKEDPIDAIAAGSDDSTDTAHDNTDLIRLFRGDDASSHVFDGQIGYLDHALASADLAQAIEQIDQSLEPAWWLDDVTLDPEDGKHVFDREHQPSSHWSDPCCNSQVGKPGMPSSSCTPALFRKPDTRR